MLAAQGEIEPKNPESVKHIIVALSELLSRFSEPDHRWLVGKNTVLNTGVYVKQGSDDLNRYSLIFYTPDDIAVACTLDMARLIKDPETQITGLIAGVCEFLTKKRGQRPNIADELVIEKAVAAEMKRLAQSAEPETIQ